jgi:hypothetical protein
MNLIEYPLGGFTDDTIEKYHTLGIGMAEDIE